MKTELNPHGLQNLLVGSLERASETAYEAVLAISHEDHGAARRQVDQLRQLRALIELSPSVQVGSQDNGHPTAQVLTRIQCAIERLSIADGVIGDWIRKSLQRIVEGEITDALDIWNGLLDQALSASWDFDTDLFVVYGNFDAQVLTALKERGQRRVLFVIEEAKETSDHLSGDVSLACTDQQVLSSLKNLQRPYPKRVSYLDIRQGDVSSEHGRERDTLIQKSLINLWSNQNTIAHFSRVWLEQGIGNIPLVSTYHNLSELDGLFSGRPAILIAPGPSLEKNIDQIRALKGRAVLIAPLQTLRRLYRAGVQPDFLVVLDAADQTTSPLDFFSGVPDHFLPPLIAAVNCHPNVMKKFRRVYVYSSGIPLDKWVESCVEQSLVPLVAASVALNCLLLALRWKCNPIVLTGQDLALLDGKQYAGDDNRGPERKQFALPGYYGGCVRSPSDYYMFHFHFEQIAEAVAASDRDTLLYNCTEGGAYIKGFQHAPLREVAAAHMASPLEFSVGALAPNEEMPENRRRQNLARVKLNLESSLKAIDDSLRQAAICDRLTQKSRNGNNFIKVLGGEEKKLRKLISNIKGFSIMHHSEIDSALKMSAQATSLSENLRASRLLYAVIRQGCTYIRPLVEEALSSIESSSGGDVLEGARCSPLVFEPVSG